jgi:hypothetical protein
MENGSEWQREPKRRRDDREWVGAMHHKRLPRPEKGSRGRGPCTKPFTHISSKDPIHQRLSVHLAAMPTCPRHESRHRWMRAMLMGTCCHPLLETTYPMRFGFHVLVFITPLNRSTVSDHVRQTVTLHSLLPW